MALLVFPLQMKREDIFITGNSRMTESEPLEEVEFQSESLEEMQELETEPVDLFAELLSTDVHQGRDQFPDVASIDLIIERMINSGGRKGFEESSEYPLEQGSPPMMNRNGRM